MEKIGASEEERQKRKGRKIKENIEQWDRNVAITRRNAKSLMLIYHCIMIFVNPGVNLGEVYTAKSGLTVQQKRGLPLSIQKCCKKKRYKRVPFNVQRTEREPFWAIGEHDKQNIGLSGLMLRRYQKVSVRNDISQKARFGKNIKDKGKEMVVSKPLFCAILNIDKGRVEQFQQKTRKGKCFC
ncbi:hypothetical protein AVEN_229461-1 [Araneus ventricosus]|uniref:Uncharacterized protein n=1 Tax=Araneus ventricosus TaxID=182803 RepID=A0A4Y2JLS3_ARAVE|nr:hypothetical protein AVEN_229461-1 [Araneus ventricosus]